MSQTLTVADVLDRKEVRPAQWGALLVSAAWNGRARSADPSGDVRVLVGALKTQEATHLSAILLALGLIAESSADGLSHVRKHRDVYVGLLKTVGTDPGEPAVRHSLVYLLGQVMCDDTAAFEACAAALRPSPGASLANEEDAEILRRCCYSVSGAAARPTTSARGWIATDSGILDERDTSLAYLGARAIDTMLRTERLV
jgi:hypothetical protein